MDKPRPYGFAFYPHQNDFLNSAEKAYAAFACGSESNLIVIPFERFRSWLPGLPTGERDQRFCWQALITKEDGDYYLERRNGVDRIKISEYLLVE